MKIQAKSQDRVIVRNGKKGKTWSKNRNKNKLGFFGTTPDLLDSEFNKILPVI